MNRPRPCSICRRWYRPHPRQGARQRVCSTPACQRERHRRACAQWRERNPDYDREARLQKRLHIGPAAAAYSGPFRPPIPRHCWLLRPD